jgi:hypothetical protein
MRNKRKSYLRLFSQEHCQGKEGALVNWNWSVWSSGWKLGMKYMFLLCAPEVTPANRTLRNEAEKDAKCNGIPPLLGIYMELVNGSGSWNCETSFCGL